MTEHLIYMTIIITWPSLWEHNIFEGLFLSAKPSVLRLGKFCSTVTVSLVSVMDSFHRRPCLHVNYNFIFILEKYAILKQTGI